VNPLDADRIRAILPAMTHEERAEAEALLRALNVSAPAPDVLSCTFPEQRACILDPSPFKIEFCTRRGAKSFSFGVECVHDSFDHPKAKYLFLGLVREEAKRIFWDDILPELNEKFTLGMKFNETTLTATMPNGARIYIGAADASQEEMRKLLGQKYRKIGIDEAQDWQNADLRELVYAVLKPAVADWRGSISMMGTPGKIAHGFFYECTPRGVQAAIRGEVGTETGWSIHAWTTFENTSLDATGRRMCDKWAAEIEDLKSRFPGVEQTNWFRRNYLGEWVVDDSLLVYAYLAERNDYESLPTPRIGRWHNILAVDLGYNDDSAFVIAAYHSHDPCLYLHTVQKEPKLDITAVANRIRWYQSRFTIDSVIIDGANKQAVAEMEQRHGLALIPADKRGKGDFIELMNADFGIARIKLHRQTAAPLRAEYASLIWDEKLMAKGHRVENAACANHAADAALYAWRWCFPYLAKPAPPDAPLPGTQAFYLAQAQREMKEIIDQRERDRRAMERDWNVRESPFDYTIDPDFMRDP
jgi:hypothetical protein